MPRPAQALKGTPEGILYSGLGVPALTPSSVRNHTEVYSPLGAQRAENTPWFPTASGVTENPGRVRKYLPWLGESGLCQKPKPFYQGQVQALSCDLMSEAKPL